MSGETAGPDPEPITSTASASPSLPATNWQIADYRMIRKIGEGGMGVVFEAEQQHPKRPVALKVIRGGRYVDEHHVKLFQREAQALGRLRHPCIATIYESGRTDDGQHFFAMELLRGETLNEYAAKRFQQPVSRTTLKELLTMFVKICDGVAYAHQRGVIHRDLKPTNILVQRESFSSDGDSTSSVPDIKILDFGLARITDADLAQVSINTDAGRIQGSVPYMSPEQVRGNPDEIDARTDVYSLGVILYELLSRRLPYELTNRSLPEAARVICEQPPAELGSLTDGSKRLDRDLRTIVFKALEKEPGRRYQSVSALQEDLARYLKNQPILAHPSSAAYHLRKLVSRHKVSFGSALILVALLAVFAVAMTIQRNRAFAAEQRAAADAQTASQVSNFLVKLFEVSNPSEARGRSLTAKEILDQGARRIEVELANQPVVQARLMDTMGKVYNSLGLYQDAHQLLQSALDRRRRTLGNEHLEVAASLNSLGELLGDEGDWKRAESLHREALEMRVRLLGNEHLDVAESMGNVAVAMTELGNYTAAEPLFRDVLQIKRKLLGDDDTRVAESLTDFGTFHVQRNDFKAAEPMLREALRINQKRLGNEHPEVSTNFNNLGMLLKDKGEFEEAESSLREALAIRRKLFGSEHIEVAQILNNLGTLYYTKVDVDSAQPLFREALAIRKKVLGDEHPLTSNSANNLAGTFISKGDYPSAEVLLRDVLRVRQKVFGREHPSVAQSLNNLAAVKRRMGDYTDAEALLREALAINRKILGEDHSEIATELFNLGHVFAGRKDYRQAESWFRQSLEMRRRIHPKDHPDIAAALYQVANALVRLHEYQAAEPLLLESFRINREKLGDSNLSTRTTAGLLVELYEAMGEREKAAQYRPVASAASAKRQ